MKIEFEKFSKDYVDLFYKWAEKPFIKDVWFREGYKSKENIIKEITGESCNVGPFVIMMDQNPVGYIQYYLTSDGWESMKSQPEGTYGFDVFIGEEGYLDKGYGTQLIIKFTDMVFNSVGAEKIVVDPAPDNKRAIRCYEKCGFVFIKKALDDIGNEIYLMGKEK